EKMTLGTNQLSVFKKKKVSVLFPHLTLCCALVAYTMLGALVFMQVEGGRKSSTEQEYRNFLSSIVKMVQNDTSKSEQLFLVNKVVVKMQDFKSIWFQSPSRWNLFGSVFFCCSIFSTVGKSRASLHSANC
uniref:Uncharacterized protein n=1 Tax=Xiphophorus couchianus TaxID=32473 RepID=A0A3B5M453_9TELE